MGDIVGKMTERLLVDAGIGPGMLDVGAIIRAMLPRIVQQGVATEEEIDVDTIDRRLIEERKKANATYVGDMVFGAWARKPG